MFETFSDLINAWPNRRAFAADHEVDRSLAYQWAFRGSIPSTHWDRTVMAAARRGIEGVNLDLLSRLERNRRVEATEAA